MDLLPTAIAVATGAVTGSALAVPLIKYLARDWLTKREAFESATLARLSAADAAVLTAERTLATTINNVREEAISARQVLRQHVDHEDGILRERNHQLAGTVGVLTNKVEIASLDVREAIAANQKTLEWCQEKYGDLMEEIHRLALEVAGGHAPGQDGERRVRQVRK